MTYLLRLVACLFVLLSFNAKATLVINGCTIEANTSYIGANLTDANLLFADLSDALYNDQTVFTTGSNPIASGMSYVPVPAAA